MKILFEVEAIDGTRYNVGYDKRCYIVQEWHVPGPDAKGEPGWKHAKSPYFGSLAAACRRLLEQGLANTTARSLDELVAQLEVWGARVEAAARGEAPPTINLGGVQTGRWSALCPNAGCQSPACMAATVDRAAEELAAPAVPSWLNPAVLTPPDK